MTKQEFRNERLIKHFYQWIDTHYHPNFILTAERKSLFLKFQSLGKKALSTEELELIESLIYAQKMKELTIKMLVEEMLWNWSENLGWYYCLQHTIDTTKNDNIFKVALLRIKKRCHESFIEFIISFTGLTQQEKNKYYKRKWPGF
jgi:hypothetical protein